MPKKKPTKKPIKSVKSPILDSPIVVFGIVFFVLIAGYFGYQAISDWRNKKTLEDFQATYTNLVAEIESETGENLKITSDCFTTTEKFSEGKKVCGVITAKNVEAESLSTYQKILESNKDFKQGESYREGAGYRYGFRSVDCQFNFEEKIRIDCLYPVRASNVVFAAELFNEEVLNQKKNEALSQ